MKKVGIFIYLFLFVSCYESFSQTHKFCVLLADNSRTKDNDDDTVSRNEIFSVIRESIHDEINFRNEAVILDEKDWIHFKRSDINDPQTFINYFTSKCNPSFVFKLTLESTKPITNEPEIKKLQLQFFDMSKPARRFEDVTVFYFYEPADVGKFMGYINRYIQDIKSHKKPPDDDNRLFVVPDTSLLKNENYGNAYGNTLMLFFSNDDLCNLFYVLTDTRPHKLSIKSVFKDSKTIEFSYKKGLVIKKTCLLQISVIGNSQQDINKYCKEIRDDEK